MRVELKLSRFFVRSATSRIWEFRALIRLGKRQIRSLAWFMPIWNGNESADEKVYSRIMYR